MDQILEYFNQFLNNLQNIIKTPNLSKKKNNEELIYF
ncbi:MAG: hypothetical protein HeimC3_39690 [Candidatus Heimdallarchaeota archaeon LC_3]|nr:MAG: hypothetical protein HeimC3_39690 [Candidatus Heimdallarchaeota archaeon LC_3]